MSGGSALLFTVLVDASVFAVALLLFFALREERGDHRKSPPLLGGRSFAAVEPSFAGDESSIKHLWNVPISELRNTDVKMYLRFLQVLAVFFWVLSFLGLAVLLPVNLAGQRFESGLERASLENIRPGDQKLWIVFGLTSAFAILAYGSVLWFRRELWREAANVARTTHVDRLAVVVRNIDKAILQSSVLYGYFHRRFPGCVVEAHLAGDFRELDSARDELDRARGALVSARHRSRHCCGPDVGRLEDKIVYHERVCQRLNARGPTSGTGVGFIVFNDAASVEEALGPCAYGWVAERAPPPTDVEWSNLLYISSSGRWFGSVCWTGALLILMLLVLSPVAILFRLQPVFKGVTSALGDDWYLRSMFVAYWPPLVVFLVNSLLTPACINIIASRQRHWRKSSREVTILTMNAFFLMLNTFLVPLMSMQSIPGFLQHFLNLPMENWATSLGTMFLSSSGGFGLQYLVSTVFLSNGAQLIQLPRTLGARKMEAPFDFGYWYASALSVLTLALGFAVVVPTILPWAALYFTVKLYVDKYNFMFCVVPPGLDSSGRLAHVILPYWCMAIALFEFCMGGFFVVQGDRFAVAGATLCMAAAGTVVAGMVSQPSLPAPKGSGVALLPGAYRSPWTRDVGRV